MIEMVKERFKRKDAAGGFILDGFPRTEHQATVLDHLLVESNLAVDHALNFDASDKTIIGRLAGRRTCVKCGEIYHLTNIPSKVPGVCDQCGGALIQRKDDSEETIRKRLEVYRRETAPLIEYYERQRLLKNVPADLEVQQLEPILEKLMS